MEIIEARLAHLEKRYRRLRAFVLILALMGLIVAVGEWRRSRRPPDPPGILVARRVVLLDESGSERLVLSADGAGPGVSLRDAAGRERASLDLRAPGPGLTYYDADAKVRVLFSLDKTGPYLGMTDERGKELFKAP